MTQHQYTSDELICNDFHDIRALTSIVIDVGSLTRVSAISDEHSITYTYSSEYIGCINELHVKWQRYLDTGYY